MNSFKLVVDEFHWSDHRFAIQVGKVEGGFLSGSSAACVAKCHLGRRCPSKTEGAGTRHLSVMLLGKLSVLRISSELEKNKKASFNFTSAALASPHLFH